MKKNKTHQAKVSTNLEKKTRQKIAQMATTGGCDAADLLKDLKVLSKFKKCHVRVARLNKNKLGKISKKKDKPQRKVRATLIRGGAIKKKPERRGRPRKLTTAQALQVKPDKTPAKTENENQTPHIERQKRKAVKSPENNKRNKERKKRQIFIRLPFLETAKLKSLNKDLIEKHYNKKANPIKRLGKTFLTERFGSRFFRCHVKVARYRSPNDPAPKKKEKFNRKSVSFVETVEVFGESDDDLPQLMNSPRTSTPAQDTCNSSNDSITVSPSRRKVSLLKNTESPRSEHMRRSDEKVPRVKSVNPQSLVAEKETDNASREAGEKPSTVSGAVDPNEHESLNVDETEHEVLPEDERVDEEHEEEEKEEHKVDQTDNGNEKEEELNKMAVVSDDETAHILNDDVRTHDEDSQEMGEDDKESVKEGDNQSGKQSVVENVDTVEVATAKDVEQQSDSHQRREDDHEASNDLPGEQIASAGNNNNSNHIELSSISDHDSNMFNDIVQNEFEVNPEPDLFTDGDDQEKEFSLQISNTSEMSALCQKPEQNDPESDSVLSNLNNIDSILDDTSDRPQAQQTKFSLNTFFKSLKTKIISQRTESIPPTKSGNQCTEHEGDQTLRDELTIK